MTKDKEAIPAVDMKPCDAPIGDFPYRIHHVGLPTIQDLFIILCLWHVTRPICTSTQTWMRMCLLKRLSYETENGIKRLFLTNL
jgi:hypothetical protein